ncbi:MAG: hypothetical protein IJ734_05160 [Fibrobacter sp.]|nr:hypothetical protein [Fibrobacter sp.]
MHFLFALLLAFFVVACGDDESSFAPRDDEPTSSSSESVTPQSSSSVRSSSSTPVEDLSSSSAKSSSSSVSSSSEYVPFDHSNTLAGAWRIGENRYSTFTDPRNGRSYYYITIYSEYKGYSVTVMAENLNIGDMVLGENDQNDDSKIERYCYNNDTTKCDEFGGLYQWAEMMQLPSECNTKSCADQIKPNHQGICPDGWRLFTYDDYCVVRGYKDEYDDGIKGLRSMHGFSGTNYSGFSLVGAGLRDPDGGEFKSLKNVAFWFYPQEHEYDETLYATGGYISGSNNRAPQPDDGDLKTYGFSVRCVMVENQAE